MPSPVVLTMGFDPEGTRAVMRAAMRLKIRVRPVHPQEADVPLGELCRTPAPQNLSAPGAPFPGAMLVMAFFPPGLMDRFLQALREANAARGALKAVLTPTNALWAAPQLYAELSRERDAIAAGRAAHAPGGAQRN